MNVIVSNGDFTAKDDWILASDFPDETVGIGETGKHYLCTGNAIYCFEQAEAVDEFKFVLRKLRKGESFNVTFIGE